MRAYLRRRTYDFDRFLISNFSLGSNEQRGLVVVALFGRHEERGSIPRAGTKVLCSGPLRPPGRS